MATSPDPAPTPGPPARGPDVSRYPPQEPMSPLAERHHRVVMDLAAGAAPDLDIQYGPDPYQGLSLWRASSAPVDPVLPAGTTLGVIHGGGWTNGYREWMAFMAPALTRHGVTVASIGYRLAPGHVFPAGADDVADAVAWLYRTLPAHGGDPQRLFIGGHSAGGHYASLIALDPQWLGARAVPMTTIRGVLPVSGVFWFGETSGIPGHPRFLGPPGSGTEGPASPMTFVRPGAPPFLIAWGERDFPHLIPQARAFAQALQDNGVAVETLELPGADHLEANHAGGVIDGPYVRSALAFMARCLDRGN